MAFTLAGERVLLADGSLVPATLTVADGRVAEIAPGRRAGGDVDAGRRLVLPGIIDLHGDAFERQVMPRPGVRFPLAMALVETDRQMVANGITTAFHGVTCSWEPGLRSLAGYRELSAGLKALRHRLAVDTRLHLRWEVSCLDAEPAILADLAAGEIGLLAFNDHHAEIVGDLQDGGADAADYEKRAGVGRADLLVLAAAVGERAAEQPAAAARLAAAARAAGVPMASHDDPEPAVRRHYAGLGVDIAEFPVTAETAQLASALGNWIIMGAPNILHGGSHKRILAAADLVGAGRCDVLVSDYYYPAPLAAPFRLMRKLGLPLGEAWALVSAKPADAAGLSDRGRLEAGRRADLLIVDDDADLPQPEVCAAWTAGTLAYADGRVALTPGAGGRTSG